MSIEDVFLPVCQFCDETKPFPFHQTPPLCPECREKFETSLRSMAMHMGMTFDDYLAHLDNTGSSLAACFRSSSSARPMSTRMPESAILENAKKLLK